MASIEAVLVVVKDSMAPARLLFWYPAQVEAKNVQEPAVKQAQENAAKSREWW